MTRYAPFLVIGIGNTLRGDDGAGAAVVRRLSEQRRPEVDYLVVRQLLPELVDNIGNREAVVFVDASVNLPPGKVILQRLYERGDSQSGFDGVQSHVLTPQGLLGLNHLVQETVPPAWCVQIGAQTFESVEELSAPVSQAIPQAVTHIVTLITDFQSRETEHA